MSSNVPCTWYNLPYTHTNQPRSEFHNNITGTQPPLPHSQNTTSHHSSDQTFKTKHQAQPTIPTTTTTSTSTSTSTNTSSSNTNHLTNHLPMETDQLQTHTTDTAQPPTPTVDSGAVETKNNQETLLLPSGVSLQPNWCWR